MYKLSSNYSLPAPNSEAKEYYFIKIKETLYYSPEIVDDLLPSSMKGVDFENISYDSKCNAASSILLESVLKNRSHKVGVLIRAANSIRKLKLNSFSDFGEQCHTKNSEPYFYESAYLYPNDHSDSQLDSPIAIPVDTNGICYVAGIVDDVSFSDRIEDSDDNFGVECSIPVPRKYTILTEVSSQHITARAWPNHHVIICMLKMATAATVASSSISTSPRKIRFKDLYDITSNDTTLQNWFTQK